MSQEEKSLLLKDLCARLPYGVKGIITYNGDKDIFTVKGIFNILFLSDTECCHVEDFKPYLRPMSSMAEKECAELRWLNDQCDAMPTFEYIPIKNYRIYDWLNRHHFDYRGLISKGLAIEAPEGMYDIKS